MEAKLTSWAVLTWIVVLLILTCYWKDPYLVLALLVGGLPGWLIGVLVSPFPQEEAVFGRYGKGLLGFATGFLVSKFDRIFELLIKPTSGGDFSYVFDVRVWRPSLFAFCGFFLALLYVFTMRHYGQRQEAQTEALAFAQIQSKTTADVQAKADPQTKAGTD